MKTQVLFVTLVASTLASAIPPKTEEHKNRIIDKELSDQEHFKDDEVEREHNSEYDHEAFLGKEDAQTFDDLDSDEAKERLGIIYEKIDKNKDDKVDEAELKDWIKHVQNRYVWSDTERQWSEMEPKGNTLSWEEYKKRTYGALDDEEEEEDDEDEDDGYSYKEMRERDEKRWKRADGNGDGQLTKEEFMDFLHPEDAEHMRDIVVDETIADIDKDKDGQISVDEYIGDMWPNQDGEDEPDWVKTEREQFHSFRDKNKDGKMDRQEVFDWIMPPDYDHSEAEAKHLIYESDSDADGFLTKDEVISKYDVFVGSQATDFGEALARHDEF